MGLILIGLGVEQRRWHGCRARASCAHAAPPGALLGKPSGACIEDRVLAPPPIRLHSPILYQHLQMWLDGDFFVVADMLRRQVVCLTTYLSLLQGWWGRGAGLRVGMGAERLRVSAAGCE